MREYRYAPRVLLGDYLRAGVGLAVGLGILLAVEPSPMIVIVFGAVAVLFGIFGLRTVQRHITKVAVTDEEICNAAFGTRSLSWSDLERFKLRYYGSKRQHKGEGGFMQLSLSGGGASLSYESSIDGFNYIAWRAAKAMRENGLSMDPTSAGNLLAMGLDADGERPPPEDAMTKL